MMDVHVWELKAEMYDGRLDEDVKGRDVMDVYVWV